MIGFRVMPAVHRVLLGAEGAAETRCRTSATRHHDRRRAQRLRRSAPMPATSSRSRASDIEVTSDRQRRSPPRVELDTQAAPGRQRRACCSSSRRRRRAEARPPRRRGCRPPPLRDRLGYAFRQPELLAPGADAPQLRRRPQRAARVRRRRGAQLRRRRGAVRALSADLPEGDLSRLRASLVNRDTLARAGARTRSGRRHPARRGRAQERRRRAAVDPGRRARGGVRRGVPRRRLRCGARGDRARLRRRRSRRLDPDVARQGSEDAAAGVAAGAPARRCPTTSVAAVTGEAHAQTFAVECRIPALAVETARQRAEPARGRAGGGRPRR